ncbi:MAG: hypothetical protein FWE45_02730 [Firmicutes bacterium]|nr:hypothetical protein [Bacillota bacterium]
MSFIETAINGFKSKNAIRQFEDYKQDIEENFPPRLRMRQVNDYINEHAPNKPELARYIEQGRFSREDLIVVKHTESLIIHAPDGKQDKDGNPMYERFMMFDMGYKIDGYSCSEEDITRQTSGQGFDKNFMEAVDIRVVPCEKES